MKYFVLNIGYVNKESFEGIRPKKVCIEDVP